MSFPNSRYYYILPLTGGLRWHGNLPFKLITGSLLGCRSRIGGIGWDTFFHINSTSPLTYITFFTALARRSTVETSLVCLSWVGSVLRFFFLKVHRRVVTPDNGQARSRFDRKMAFGPRHCLHLKWLPRHPPSDATPALNRIYRRGETSYCSQKPGLSVGTHLEADIASNRHVRLDCYHPHRDVGSLTWLAMVLFLGDFLLYPVHWAQSRNPGTAMNVPPRLLQTPCLKNFLQLIEHHSPTCVI